MACNGMYWPVSTYIPPKNLEFMNYVLVCNGMYWYVLACIDIYTPKKPRIYELCIGM